MANEEEEISGSGTDDAGTDDGGQETPAEETQPKGNPTKLTAVVGAANDRNAQARATEDRDPANRKERREAWKRERDKASDLEKRNAASDRRIAELTSQVASLTTATKEFVGAQAKNLPGQTDPRSARLKGIRKEMNDTLAAMKHNPALIDKYYDLQDEATDLRADMRADEKISTMQRNQPRPASSEGSALEREFPWIRDNKDGREMTRIYINQIASKYSDEEWKGNPQLRYQVGVEAALKAANELRLPIPSAHQQARSNAGGRDRVAGTGGGGRASGNAGPTRPAMTEGLLQIAWAKFPSARSDEEAFGQWWDRYGKKVATGANAA